MPPESGPLRVLIVDDDRDYARLLATLVRETGLGTPTVAGTVAEALPHLPASDLVLLDHQLPDGAGLELLPALRAVPGQPAVILVTAHGDESLAARALRAGADDYLIKDPALPTLLPQAIERARRIRALRETLAAAERDLVHAERIAAIGQLQISLHHAINNPLMAASAEVDLLLGDQGLTVEQRSAVTTVQEALQRIRSILERVANLRHDQTTEYLDGIRMIDLSRRTRPTPAYRGEAVVWLPDSDLARVVAMLLRHAGFDVTRVNGITELAGRTGNAGVSAVIVSGTSLPGAEPLGGFHPASQRDYLIVALVEGDDAAAREAGADLVVPLPFDPGSFAAEIVGAMS